MKYEQQIYIICNMINNIYRDTLEKHRLSGVSSGFSPKTLFIGVHTKKGRSSGSSSDPDEYPTLGYNPYPQSNTAHTGKPERFRRNSHSPEIPPHTKVTLIRDECRFEWAVSLMSVVYSHSCLMSVTFWECCFLNCNRNNQQLDLHSYTFDNFNKF